MSSIVEEFITHLGPRVTGTLHGTAKIVIKDQGSIMMDDKGASMGDDIADVTLTASEKTFRDIFAGTQNPMMAFASGKLKVDGSNMRALKVAEILIG